MTRLCIFSITREGTAIQDTWEDVGFPRTIVANVVLEASGNHVADPECSRSSELECPRKSEGDDMAREWN